MDIFYELTKSLFCNYRTVWTDSYQKFSVILQMYFLHLKPKDVLSFIYFQFYYSRSSFLLYVCS